MRQQAAAHLLRNYGSLLLDMGRVDEARKAAEEAVAIRAATVGVQHAGYADALDGMGDVLRIAGDLAGAESKFRESVKVRADLPATTPLDLARSQIGLAETLVARAQFAQARELALDSLNARRAALPPGHPWITHARGILGCAMAGLGETASARDELLTAAEAMRKDPGSRSYRATMILNALKSIAERAGDSALVAQCARDIDRYRDRGR
jgi:tetratricopeptide (TPR) repeat protein